MLMRPTQNEQMMAATLAEHKALFALERLNQLKLERPKVEATNHEGFICVGGFSNPL
jgi:hypothetical protein